LFSRLTALTGIQLVPQAVQQLENDPWSFEFVDSDVKEVHARPRFMDIIDYAGACIVRVASRLWHSGN
jgi:hypothetical protein